MKIGRPGYRVTKAVCLCLSRLTTSAQVQERDPETQQKALLFEVEYPEVHDRMSKFLRNGVIIRVSRRPWKE